MLEATVSNPLGWAQIKLLGGWKRVLGIGGAYAALLMIGLIVVYRGVHSTGVSLSSFASGSLTFLIFIEASVIFFVGSAAIKKAIHRDYTTEMISSHRMTAMTGNAAVFGYLTGATAQVQALTVVNWVVTTILAAMAGLTMPINLLAPTVILMVFCCLAATVYTLTVLVALSTRGTVSIAGLLVVLVFLSNVRVVDYLPGLGLLLGFTTLKQMPSATVGGVSDPTIVISMLVQLVYALAFFIAAARKFTRDDVPAFNPPLAYAVLALSALVAAVALGPAHPAPAMFIPMMGLRAPIQIITTIGALALVAFLPVANAARNTALWTVRRRKDPRLAAPAPRHYLIAPILSTLIVYAILAAIIRIGSHRAESIDVDTPEWAAAMSGWSVLAFLLTLVSVSGLLRFVYSASEKATWVLVLYLVLAWAFPPLIDISLASLAGSPTYEMSWIFGCSPVGTWIIAVRGLDALSSGSLLIPGLIVQAVVAGCMLLLATRARR